jgi:hypothetical protein
MRVTFLRADKAMFAGLLLPSAVVVLDSADLAYLNARYGIHYPVRFPAPWFNKARTKAVVHWDAGWTAARCSSRSSRTARGSRRWSRAGSLDPAHRTRR